MPKQVLCPLCYQTTGEVGSFLDSLTGTIWRFVLVNFITVMEIATGAVACLKPIPIEKDRTSEREVLPIKRLGSPWLTYSATISLKSSLP